MKSAFSRCHPSKYVSKCGLNLADIYRFYNSGYWFFYESELGGFECNNDEMKKHCVRGGVMISGRYLNFCDVSYSYPHRVYESAQKYKIGNDNIRFWYKGEK